MKDGKPPPALFDAATGGFVPNVVRVDGALRPAWRARLNRPFSMFRLATWFSKSVILRSRSRVRGGISFILLWGRLGADFVLCETLWLQHDV